MHKISQITSKAFLTLLLELYLGMVRGNLKLNLSILEIYMGIVEW